MPKIAKRDQKCDLFVGYNPQSIRWGVRIPGGGILLISNLDRGVHVCGEATHLARDNCWWKNAGGGWSPSLEGGELPPMPCGQPEIEPLTSLQPPFPGDIQQKSWSMVASVASRCSINSCRHPMPLFTIFKPTVIKLAENEGQRWGEKKAQRGQTICDQNAVWTKPRKTDILEKIWKLYIFPHGSRSAVHFYQPTLPKTINHFSLENQLVTKHPQTTGILWVFWGGGLLV